MVSTKLRNLFFISIIVFFVHGAEEIITGFHQTDVFIKFFADFFASMSQSIYYTFHVMWWLMLIVAFLFLLGGKWHLRLMTVFGLILIFELHHLIKAIEIWGYYPGMITALLFPILAFFFWRELIANFRQTKQE